MKIIADLHIHSKYSRATSKDMEVQTLSRWAEMKGINLLGTGDFTHPIYFSELKRELEEAEEGLYKPRGKNTPVRFMLTAEVSNIFTQDGMGRRIHSIILSPSFETAERINKTLSKKGDLLADGRPTFTFPVKDLLKMLLEIDERCMLIPAHAWTPWFSIFGSNSGFNSIEEAFGDLSKFIYAIETGLSSDPPMNWRLSALDKITLVSNSDAHSPSRIGRECNLFDCELSYTAITDAIKKKDKKRFLCTIEFFPEEGKYHYDGHRACNVSLNPKETIKLNGICPKCGKKLTIGVLHRVEELADREEGKRPENSIDFKHLVPLAEIIGEAIGAEPSSKAVESHYEKLILHGGSEIEVLLETPLEELKKFALPRIIEGIRLVREGKVKVEPGYDGVYGKIKIFDEDKKEEESKQISLFG